MLTVLLATRGRPASLRQVLESYTRLTPPPGGWELIVADGPPDMASGVVRGFADRLPAVHMPAKEVGKSRALNQALELAAGDLILFTDDDILPERSWLAEYVAAAAAHPDFDIFGGPVRPKWPSEPPRWAVCDLRARTACFMDTGPPPPSGPTETWMTGQNLAIRRRALSAEIRFDARLGAGDNEPMGEEVHLTERLRRQGCKTWWVAGAQVEHIIRLEQLNKRWMLHRASRFGRSEFWLNAEFRRETPRLAGMPRWLVRHALEQAARVAAACIRGSEEELFVARWNLRVMLAELGEARRLRGSRDPAGLGSSSRRASS